MRSRVCFLAVLVVMSVFSNVDAGQRRFRNQRTVCNVPASGVATPQQYVNAPVSNTTVGVIPSLMRPATIQPWQPAFAPGTPFVPNPRTGMPFVPPF